MIFAFLFFFSLRLSFFGKIVIRASANVSRRHQRPTRFPLMLVCTRVTSSTREAAHHTTSYALHSTLIGFCVTIWQEVDVSHKKKKKKRMQQSFRLAAWDFEWVTSELSFCACSWAEHMELECFCFLRGRCHGSSALLSGSSMFKSTPWNTSHSSSAMVGRLRLFFHQRFCWGSDCEWLCWSPLLPVLESTAKSTWCHWSPIQREECNHLEWHASCCCPSDWPTRSSFIGGEPLLAQRACSGACDFGSCRVLLRTLFFWRCLELDACKQEFPQAVNLCESLRIGYKHAERLSHTGRSTHLCQQAPARFPFLRGPPPDRREHRFISKTTFSKSESISHVAAASRLKPTNPVDERTPFIRPFVRALLPASFPLPRWYRRFGASSSVRLSSQTPPGSLFPPGR